jgi:diacylglycerol kinase
LDEGRRHKGRRHACRDCWAGVEWDAQVAKTDPFSIGKRARSFRFAWRGLLAVATFTAIAAGLCLRLGSTEWALLAFAIVGVWGAEAFNTAIEALGNAVSPDDHPLVGMAKDAAAGAVLVTAVGAAVIGGLVFLPRLARVIGYGW